jgi:hypothetical protein
MKAVHAMAMIPAPGDVVYVDLDGYGQASEATVVNEENGEIDVACGRRCRAPVPSR